MDKPEKTDSIGYTRHTTKTNKTHHRKLKRWATRTSQKFRLLVNQSASWKTITSDPCVL